MTTRKAEHNRRRFSSLGIGIGIATGVLALLLAAAISSLFVDSTIASLGLPDPGAITTLGVPALRAVAWLLTAFTVGCFLLPVLLPRSAHTADLRLNPAARDLIAAGGAAGITLGIIGIILVPLSLSDVSGMPLGETIRPEYWKVALREVSDSRSWLVVAAIALAVGLCARRATSWAASLSLLCAALAAVLPRAMSGHSAAGGNHDIGTDFYILHTLAAVMWVGGLAAVLVYGRRQGPGRTTALLRFSQLAVALICTMALTGIGNALLRVPLDTLLGTAYGVLACVKALLICVLAGFGWAHRRNIQRNADPSSLHFFRLAAGEIAVMAATMAVAVSMSRTPPPPPNRDVTYTALLIGYDVIIPPTWPEILGAWRPNVVFTLIAVALALAYHRCHPMSRLHAALFYIGCATLALTLNGPIGYYMPAMFSFRMLGQVILGLIVPLLLVLGRPRELLQARCGEYVHALGCTKINPWLATVQFLIVFYAQFTIPQLHNFISLSHGLRVVVYALTLISGTIFVATIVRQRALKAVLASMIGHTAFCVYLSTAPTTIGARFYRSLSLPWSLDLVRDQSVYGTIAWMSSLLPLAVILALCIPSCAKSARI